MSTYVKPPQTVPRYALRKTAILTANKAICKLEQQIGYPSLRGELTPFEVVSIATEFGITNVDYERYYNRVTDGISGKYEIYYDFETFGDLVDFLWENLPPDHLASTSPWMDNETC